MGIKRKCVQCNHTYLLESKYDQTGGYKEVCVFYGQLGIPPFVPFLTPTMVFNEPLLAKVWYCELCR